LFQIFASFLTFTFQKVE